jgi:hypothetical protein
LTLYEEIESIVNSYADQLNGNENNAHEQLPT